MDKQGKKPKNSKFSNKQLKLFDPFLMLDFYESKLNFKYNTPKKPKNTKNTKKMEMEKDQKIKQ